MVRHKGSYVVTCIQYLIVENYKIGVEKIPFWFATLFFWENIALLFLYNPGLPEIKPCKFYNWFFNPTVMSEPFPTLPLCLMKELLVLVISIFIKFVHLTTLILLLSTKMLKFVRLIIMIREMLNEYNMDDYTISNIISKL